MLRNYFVIAVRNLVKSPGLSSIKIAGLAIGVCGCIVVFLLAKLELSFDKHHTKGENIYRVYTEYTGVWEGASRAVPLPFPAAFRERSTGVEAVAQVLTHSWDVEIGEKKFPGPNHVALVDSDYFKVFPDYRWIFGNPKALGHPHTVVLVESKAKKYFGNIDLASIIGQRVTYSDSLDLIVGGIVADPVENTDFNFTEFISLSTIQASWLKESYEFDDWRSTSSSWMCMIRLTDGTSPGNFDDLLATMTEETMAKEKEVMDSKGEKVTSFIHYRLQPLSEIHFNLELGTWNSGRSSTSMGTIEALLTIALLLLLVAVINFVNLETAQTLRRAREVGVRKVMGGTRASLVIFFLAESFVITFIAVVFALPLAKLSIIFFSEFLPKEVSLDLTDPIVWVFVVGLTSIVAILSGIYPAFVLSSYQPAVALKANRGSDRSTSAVLRKILTVFQFTFSQALIAGAMIIGLQVSWMLNKDLGFVQNSIVTVYPPWEENNSNRILLKNELEKLSSVELTSLNTRAPAAYGYSNTKLIYNDGKQDIPFSVSQVEGDTSYVRLFGLRLLTGRNINPGDSLNEILVNEAYCKKIGLMPLDMVGKDLKRSNGTIYHVVGVLKDFHHASLHQEITPLFYEYGQYSRNSTIVSVRLTKDADLKSSMDDIKTAIKRIYGDSQVEVQFIDEVIQKYYETERRISKLVNTATALAIFISCLGLLGLASFTAIQRTKEIGIRKVLGATVTSIVMLLSREFIVLVVISFVIAVPIAWYPGNQWLETFPYRINPGVWIFLAAGLISVLVALVTVGFQAIKAAVVNPVESLRYE